MTNDYYIKRPINTKIRFEEDYHDIVIDPDGIERNLISAQERSHKLRNFSAEVVEELNRSLKGGKILDIGCGPGWILSTLKDQNWEKFGVEISKFVSDYASQFGQIYNGSVLDYETEIEFDAIIMHHVIEHLDQPILAIQKIYKFLKQGGVFIIGTPNFDCAAARRYGNNFRLLHYETHTSLFTEDSMHRFLRDFGFKIYKVERPFFDTEYFNRENLLKVLGEDGLSPPMYGSVMTFFAIK